MKSPCPETFCGAMVFNAVRMGVLKISIRRSKGNNVKVRHRRKLLAVGEKERKGIRRGGFS